ncbi:MAG: contact-dependent growth inhibition system immunity protein [Vicinamibacterales bacterium]
MSADRRKPPASAPTRAKLPAGFELPALAAFLAGYLHEDFVAEHDTPEGAIRAFSRDATAGERRQLATDLERYLALSAGWSWRDVRRGWTGLGGAWAPRSRHALSVFAAAVAAAAGR